MRNLDNVTRLLDEAERLVFNSFNGAKIGLWTWDIAADKVSWDKNLLNIFEMSYDYFKNGYKGYKEIVFPEYHSELEQKLADCINNDSTFLLSYKVKSKNPQGFKTVLVKGSMISNLVMSGIVIEI